MNNVLKIGRALFIGALVCTQSQICIRSTSAASADEVYAGITAYNRNDFGTAVKILNKVLLAGRESALGHCYLANAYIRLGNRAEAIRHYQIALTQHPSTEINNYCLKAIKDYGIASSSTASSSIAASSSVSSGTTMAPATAAKVIAADPKNGYLGIELQDCTISKVFSGSPAEKAKLAIKDRILMINGVSTHSLTAERIIGMLRGDVGTSTNLTIDRSGIRLQVPITRAEPVSEMSANTSKYAESRKSPSRAAADDIDQKMIVIHKRTDDTDAVYAQVINALSLIPRHVKEELSNFGTKIVIARTLLDVNPEMAHDKPRGYIHGGGYDNCPGMYIPSNNQIFVGERASWHNSPPQLNHWVKSTMLHEMGHAYDHCRSDESRSSAFTAAYQKDFQHLSVSEKNEHYYYCQEGDAGPCELFAELFALNLSSAGGIDQRSPSLARAFPTCFSHIQTFVGK